MPVRRVGDAQKPQFGVNADAICHISGVDWLPMLRSFSLALLALALAACDASTGFGASPIASNSVVPGSAGAAPAVANMGCVGAGAKAFQRPWQTIVLGGSRQTFTGHYEVQLINGSDGSHAICTVTSDGLVLAIAPA